MRQLIRNLAVKGRRTEILWRYGFNFSPSFNYKLGLASASRKVLPNVIENLNRDGIAVTSVGELLQDQSLFAELDSTVSAMMAKRRDELAELKRDANNEDAIGAKTFNVELLGSPLDFDANSIFARFALQETFLNIANAYFGMLVKLRYYNVWNTFATNSTFRESQLWHFDREDNYILKVFLYLKDVDEGTGPFTYAPATHRKGRLWGKHPEFTLEQGVRRSADEQMSAVVPQKDWVRALGKKGTIVFADTRGYHKGGEARTDDRLMYTCMFTSPASESKRLLKYPKTNANFRLTPQQLCALETV